MTTIATTVLLGSVDASFADDAVRRAVELAGPQGRVYVVSTARVYGTSFGLPHPGLYPSKSEREQHRRAVADTVRAIERAGRQAEGEVLATRHAARMLGRRARQRDCSHIVVSAGPPPRMTLFSWAGEPYRLARRARVPVEVVTGESCGRGRFAT